MAVRDVEGGVEADFFISHNTVHVLKAAMLPEPNTGCPEFCGIHSVLNNWTKAHNLTPGSMTGNSCRCGVIHISYMTVIMGMC